MSNSNSNSNSNIPKEDLVRLASGDPLSSESLSKNSGRRLDSVIENKLTKELELTDTNGVVRKVYYDRTHEEVAFYCYIDKIWINRKRRMVINPKNA